MKVVWETQKIFGDKSLSTDGMGGLPNRHPSWTSSYNGWIMLDLSEYTAVQMRCHRWIFFFVLERQLIILDLMNY